MTRTILDGYESAAEELIERFENVSSAELYAEVSHLLPASNSGVLNRVGRLPSLARVAERR
ncbi:MAG: hypothetical protein HOW73_24215 [Polyangiaceae bacterium]|nr:hypothetical protein [Polyangiaceae bacterium]